MRLDFTYISYIWFASCCQLETPKDKKKLNGEAGNVRYRNIERKSRVRHNKQRIRIDSSKIDAVE